MNRNILEYLKRIQAMAKTGLTYSENPYDIERYEEMRDSTNELLAQLSNAPLETFKFHFEELDNDYPTPKVDVRGLVMKEGKILLIQEKTDQKWSMPGGWCDIGYSASENVVKEVFEEAGIRVKPVRILSVWDKAKQDHPHDIRYVYKINFLCEIVSGELNVGHEALDGGFFALDELPPLSEVRNTERQIMKLMELVESGELDWD
ncbi:MAG: ADP-ribose pyrophosphatase [Flammeovirgaceae bacterium]|nr:ADP-ribose pyrophosphatase [Flammeovirgaceae bacterium]MBE60758.1 ADP-ribose pyrophosphatase [Flammeovirgaceae bacterium]